MKGMHSSKAISDVVAQHRLRLLWLLLALMLGHCGASAAGAGSATDWVLIAGPAGRDPGRGIAIGAHPGCADGYDGQAALDVNGDARVEMLFRRPTEAGPLWSGPEGWYVADYESPIPGGQSKTWWGIYLWSQNYVPYLGNRTEILWAAEHAAPVGYWARLYLDYVPAECEWPGPWQMDLPLSGAQSFPLPVIETSNPFQGVRMHLTVFTPEPSSLAALLVGLTGLGAAAWRRRPG